MRLSVEQYAEALHELTQTSDVEKVLVNFKAFLKRRGEEGRLGAILKILLQKEETKENILSLTVTTRYEASQEMQSSIEKKAEELFPGKKLSLLYRVDEKVLGGFRLQGRDTVYDSTLSQSLKKISQTLKS
ncbi:MAG: F0F1 ATP synthase subunit delta [Candidatus Moranbacteria bacterium]|nr:F0F1 ATP synthase subunit delta [Candidatus Moranbacteria bacterium]